MANFQFDIRQWVLVTSWDPLTIWFYEDCYVRFSALDWNETDVKSKFIHLCNNSIAKYCKEEDHRIKGNMWDTTTFSNYCKENFGSDLFKEKF